MSKFVLVDRGECAERHWKRPVGYAFASGDTIAPLVLGELAAALFSFPVAFVRERERFELVAVLSCLSNRNLFVAENGGWRGRYIPVALRAYPFRFFDSGTPGQKVLCIAEDSLLPAGQTGAPFFEPGSSNLTQDVRATVELLEHAERSRLQTAAAIDALVEADVIIEWPITVGSAAGQSQLTGLFRIDEERLSALSNEAFLNLRTAGALALAYGQLYSLRQIEVFSQLVGAISAPATQRPASLAEVFHLHQEPTLRFD